MVRPLILILPVLMLGACGSEPADPLDPQDRAAANEAVAEENPDADMLAAGQWETKSLMRSIAQAGLASESKEEIRGTEGAMVQCLLEVDRGRPSPPFFTGSDEGTCTYSDFSMKDGRIQAKMACTGTPGNLGFSLNGTYTQTSYDIDASASRGGAPGAAVSGSAKLTGTWLGPCEGEPDGNATN